MKAHTKANTQNYVCVLGIFLIKIQANSHTRTIPLKSTDRFYQTKGNVIIRGIKIT